MRCDKCGFENPDGMRFCGQCATPLNHTCPECGFPNPSNFEFCGQCATRLVTPESLDRQSNINNGSLDPSTPEYGEAERRQLTVLFCDIVGSSALSSRIDPEDLRDIMRDYRATCNEVVTRFDGFVAQYLGDGILVYFGHPHAHEDDARRATHAALEIIERIQQFRFPIRNSADVNLEVRIGVHTGLVVIGELGGGDKRTLALGDTPNIAARIQDFAKPNSVVVSKSTLGLLGKDFEYGPLGQHKLKGIPVPLDLFHIQQTQQQQNRLAGARALSNAPLVGRNQETSLILERLDQARKGVGQVVLLGGEPGLGKTRMVQLVCQKVAHDNCFLMECAGTPYYKNSFLFPVIGMVSRTLGLSKDNNDVDNLLNIEQAVETLGLNNKTAVPILCELLSVPISIQYETMLGTTPQQKKQQIMDLLVEILQSMAKKKFILLVVEDLQWVDPSTIELLTKLASQSGLSNIFALFTFRNEFAPPWHAHTHITLITLNRLTRQQSGKLVHQLVNQKYLPMDVFSEIINKTDGVPFFVEELTNTVLRSDLLMEKDDHYELNMPMESLGIPATLQDSLMSRLDSLGKDKELAQLSSILGKEFGHELLSAVSPQNESSLRMSLNRLINAELFFQRGLPPKSQYSFRHALLRETAYNSLLKRTRQKYHQHIATLLLERFPSIVSDNPEIMAHHCTEAGDYSEAVNYWLAAGQLSVKRSANIEAVAHLSNGLLALDNIPESQQRHSIELAIQTTLGIAVIMCKGYAAPEVERAYSRAREISKNITDTDAVFPTLCGLWEYYIVRAELDTALGLAEEIQALANGSKKPALELEAQRILGTTHFWRGNLTDALLYFNYHDNLSATDHSPSNRLVSYCQDARVATLANASVVLWLLGQPDQALEHAHQALDLAKQLAHPFSQAYALQFLATVFQLRGDRESSRKIAEAQIALSETYGFPFWAATGKMIRAWADTNHDTARTTSIHFHDALKEYESSGNQLARSYFLALLSEVQQQAGDTQAACNTIDIALREMETSGEQYFSAELLRIKGELAISDTNNPDIAAAEELLNSALFCAQQQNANSLSLRAVISITKLLSASVKTQDDLENIQTLLNTHLALINEGQDTADLLAIKQLISSIVSKSAPTTTE